MTKNLIKTLRLLLVLTLPGALAAQHLSLPKMLANPPFDVDDRKLMLDKGLDYATDEIYDSKRTTDEAWMAFTDRDGVQIYKDSKLKKPLGMDMGAVGTKGVIHDESDEGVEVAKDGQVVGWIRKSECVLWKHPLVRQNTAVDIKAFIVNTKDKGLMEQITKNPKTKDVYQIYPSPDSKELRETRDIYQILFVYKYDETNDRYLLSNNYRLNDHGQLLGWVDRRRVKIWDTAIALEPNWEDAAFKEREANKRILASVYDTFQDARKARDGEDVEVLLTRDPVTMTEEQRTELIHPSKKRYLGDVPRFPYFSTSDEIMHCGAIGKANVSNIGALSGTNDYEYARLRKKMEDRERLQYNTNVVFLIEGTSGMNHHTKTTIPAAVEKIYGMIDSERRNRLKFGMVAYVDGDCGASRDDIIQKRVKLTSDKEDFIESCKRTPVYTYDDGDAFVASRYGLFEAMESTDMQPHENNIIIHLGRGGDVSQNMSRASACAGGELPFIDESRLNLSIRTFRPAIVSIQTVWKDDRAYKRFKRMKEVMTNAAASINDSEKEKFIAVMDSENIVAVAVEKDGFIDIANSPSLMRVYSPSVSDAEDGSVGYSEEQLQMIISESFEACLTLSKDQLGKMQRLFHDNGKMGSAVSEYGAVLSKSLADIDPELLKLLASERVHLFSNAFTYMRHPQAQYDSYRHVLFLKQSSVDELKKLFDRIESVTEDADLQDRKDELKKSLKRFAKSMLNVDDLDNVDIEIKDIRRQITGVMEETDLGGGNSLLARLTAFEDIDELSEEEVNGLYQDLRKRGVAFKSEVYVKGGYPFRYHAGIGDDTAVELEFYWIPIDFLF